MKTLGLLFGSCLAILLIAPFVPAQAPEVPPAAPKETAQTAALEEIEKTAPPSASGVIQGYVDPSIDHRLAALHRLHEQLSDLKLEPQKRKTIDRYFDDYMAGLLNPMCKPKAMPNPEDVFVPQELPGLYKELVAAKAAGDAAAIEKLEIRIRGALISENPCIADSPAYFINKIAYELPDDLKPEFVKMIERWHGIRVGEFVKDNAFRQLLRATLRDPTLKLTDEQRRTASTTLIDAHRAVSPQDRHDRDKMLRIAQEIKPKVREILEPNQREHWENTLTMLEKWEKEDAALMPKLRERLLEYKRTQASARDSAPNPTSP